MADNLLRDGDDLEARRQPRFRDSSSDSSSEYQGSDSGSYYDDDGEYTDGSYESSDDSEHNVRLVQNSIRASASAPNRDAEEAPDFRAPENIDEEGSEEGNSNQVHVAIND